MRCQWRAAAELLRVPDALASGGNKALPACMDIIANSTEKR